MIDFFDGGQLPFCSLVSWLSSRIAFPGFLRPLAWGFFPGPSEEGGLEELEELEESLVRRAIFRSSSATRALRISTASLN
jgi:hypothetical protein